GRWAEGGGGGGWAESLLAKRAGRAQPAEPPASTEILDELVTRFGLAPLERALVDLVHGVERSLAAGRMVRELSGRGRLTVELARALLGPDVEAALGGRGALRARGRLAGSAPPG